MTGMALAAITAGAGIPAATASAAVPQRSAAAASFDPAPVRDLLARLPDPVVAGALVRVAGDGPVMPWTGTAGEVSRDAHFRIGSVTKAFTSTVMLQLVAERRIDIDAPVRPYLPDLIPAAYGTVTVRELLDHTSGLPAPAGVPGPADGPGWWRKSVSPQDVVRNAFAAAESRGAKPTPPKSVQQYNGVNTFVVGLLVEKVTGRTFKDELTRRIIRPLGLRNTSLPSPDDMSIPAPHARVYVGTDEVTEQSPWAWAEGGMISTAADLDRFITALFRGRLLPPAQQELAFTVPNVDNAPTNKNCINGTACFSAGGLMRVTLDNGVTVWGKTGSLPGWTNGVFATRDLKRRVAYSLNPTGTASERPYVMGVVNSAFKVAG
ncbi:serine hydrolase domain-containing protein [Streptomyces hesseae]|uniref:Serine hydrolase domain-containing protein n=1 Tax=Streptomyces hesseae TaxID=3075519 RepID=A0ABU2SJ75_9ACTN|nr:serine hydrolase domain-containing protein [Streptomyces sp. DSM 40473]MDT0448993.1 serine hydrolase domain-containing protein [Streptomyces sp. DSM 40473]